MKYLLALPFLLLCGCGTMQNPLTKLYSAFNYEQATPEQIEALGNTVSNTGIALSYFVYGGIFLILAGIIMLAFSISKHAGVIFIVGGFSCGFTGHIIEEYAHYALITALAIGLTYGGFRVGNKWGRKLGYEEGKDFAESDNT